MTGPLVPAPIEASGTAKGRLPFGFGVRFFVALLIGFVWVVPAWLFPRLILMMFLWDALAVAAWLYDLLRLPRPSAIHAKRNWREPLSLARQTSVSVAISNTGRFPIRVSVVDEIPTTLRDRPPVLESIAGANPDPQQYDIVPRQRGDVLAGNVFLRYQSPLGLAERWAVASLAQTVRVLPDLVQARERVLYLIRSRQVELEKRRRRQRGIGREFESLRDYRAGDELRTVYWPATARRHQLTTRTYEAERSQSIWIVIDAGRLSRARVEDPAYPVMLSKLDYAVNAALSIAEVASQFGDRVGLLAYGRSIQQLLRADRGSRHIRAMVDALAQVRGEPFEADHARAARTLLKHQTRRSLIIWITDFAETPATPEVIEYATQISRRHLVLFAALTQLDVGNLARSIPQTEEEMFRYTAAVEIVQRRELLLRALRQRGVLAMELSPGQSNISLVNEYLRIKDRSLI